MAGIQYKLQVNDIAILKGFQNNDDYVAAYAHIRGIVADALKQPQDAAAKANLEGLAALYRIAWHVNQNDSFF